jgi:hypothetical protein
MFDFLKKHKKEEEKCQTCHKGKLVNQSNEGGNIVKKFSCGHKHFAVSLSEPPIDVSDNVTASKINVRKISEENISVTDNISITVSLFFELKEKIYIGGDMINAPNIELVPDEDKNYLKAFTIKVKDTDDQSIKEATELANRFTNYLSIITRIPVSHKRPRIRKTQGEKSTSTISFTMDAVLVKNQDLDVSKLSSFLSSDSRVHQHLKQAQEGLKALLDNNFPDAIRWFFMIIENQNSSDSTKYEPLRNVVSHEKLDYPFTINGVAKFGISMNNGDHLNFNDPDIQDILEREAKNLMNIVISVVENELKNI